MEKGLTNCISCLSQTQVNMSSIRIYNPATIGNTPKSNKIRYSPSLLTSVSIVSTHKTLDLKSIRYAHKPNYRRTELTFSPPPLDFLSATTTSITTIDLQHLEP